MTTALSTEKISVTDKTGVMAGMPALHVQIEHDGKTVDLYNLDHDPDAWVLMYGEKVEYLSPDDAKTLTEHIAKG